MRCCNSVICCMKYVVSLIIALALWCVGASAQKSEQQRQIEKLNLVYQQIRNAYVDDVPLGPLVEEAIRATIKELDPHSTYLTKKELEAMRSRMKGQFAGVGMSFMSYRDTVVVRGVNSDSPAERSGLRLNDRIVSVDGRDVIGIDSDSIMSLLRGDEGTELTLGIRRRGEAKELTINITRDVIQRSAIDAAFRIGDIGYISATSFSRPLAVDFMREYYGLGDVKALIVDLRDNGGGIIGSAIDLTSIFLKKGDLIVSTDGRIDHEVCYRNNKPHSIDIPLVVLINESSASASEIFAGAIQDHDRGVIVGRTSFGKGLVQRTFELGDGSGINLTIARYKTPSGRLIQRPYTMGESEAYRRDTMRFIHPDSLEYDPELMFTTLKRGRKVYGGGGITPDIFCEESYPQISDEMLEMVESGLITQLRIELWDGVKVETLSERYPTFEDLLAEDEMDGEIIEIFEKLTKCRYSELSDIDKLYLSTMIRAEIASQLFGKSAQRYVVGRVVDDVLKRAVELLESPEEYERVLSGDM